MLSIINKHSPYLSRLASKYPQLVQVSNKQQECEAILSQLAAIDIAKTNQAELYKLLRVAKGKVALLTALADISNEWPLEQVTKNLSDFANLAVNLTLKFLLHTNREVIKNHQLEHSGIIVLAMGKLGGEELNYSSDIDLIFFYEPNKIGYKGKYNEQQFLVNLVQEFTNIMQKFTADGYVFRVDLRLRPDPFSTPVIINTVSALNYYETVGQNWERSAYIKARQIAGDYTSGQQFMDNLSSYIWRKYLDMAAMQDIHSIKRQIEAKQNYTPDSLLGYNIKLGKGGIREIEFFVQIQQLIKGGKITELRGNKTCASLQQLAKLGDISQKQCDDLIAAYKFYRAIEHRLQMVNDAKTHTLPKTHLELQNFIDFLGIDNFTSKLQNCLSLVQKYYAELFAEYRALSNQGNLVFTGVSYDPETLVTLQNMGFNQAKTVWEIISGWHHGRRRATRFKKVKEILTEITPDLLKAFANCGNPNAAFIKFDDFLGKLPSGMQLFMLYEQKPELLQLTADIMGNSPWLAEALARNPNLINYLLSYDYLKPISSFVKKSAKLQNADISDLRKWKHELDFQLGIRLLKNVISPAECSKYLSDIAQFIITQITKQISNKHEVEIAVLALGRLGLQSLTFNSDLDLIFLHKGNTRKAIRCVNEVITTLSTLTSDGKLYEVDTRLRPQGSKGAISCTLQAFDNYYKNQAWDWEDLALTKSRVIFGDAELTQQINNIMQTHIAVNYTNKKLKKHLLEIRDKIQDTHKTDNIWDIKYIAGGIYDLEFILQYQLLVSKDDNKYFDKNICGKELANIYDFYQNLNAIIKLISVDKFDANNATKTHKQILVDNLGFDSFIELEQQLQKYISSIIDKFNKTYYP